MKIFYSTSATAQGGRAGRSALDDGSMAVTMTRPGSAGTGTNPEQLFALGYAACFDSAMELVARQLGLTPANARTTVKVGIGQTEAGGYALDLDITAHLPGMDAADAERLVEATHQVCPYSHATRGNIAVRLHTDTTEGETA